MGVNLHPRRRIGFSASMTAQGCDSQDESVSDSTVTSPKGLHGGKHRFAVNRGLRACLQGRQAPSRWDLEA